MRKMQRLQPQMAAIRAAARAGRPTQPMLVVLAGADRVVSNQAARRFARRLRQAEMVEIPGARHEILQEALPWRQAFWQAVDDFLVRHDL